MFLSVIISGLNLVERYPYETVQRDYDYVRLASISAGKFNFIYSHFISLHTVVNFEDVLF